MSKSIKDYRDAMDSIKISDSFYKRTETLLTELPEIKLEKKPVFAARRITAALSVTAACLAIALGLKFAMDRRAEMAEITSLTEITSITSEITVTETASPVIDKIEEGVAGDNIEGYELDSGGADVDTEPAETKAASAADGGAALPTSETTSATAATVKSPAVGKANEGTEGAHSTTSVPSSETAPAGTAVSVETVPMLSDISYEYVTVEITPYFNMGTVKSGENPVKLKGVDCKDIIEFIAKITENSHEIGNYSFTSVFSLQIADENIGLTFYSIYVTDKNSVVVTKHDVNGQIRVTYGVDASDYEALMHILFLQFGAEDDYELFSNLISGK